MAAPDRDRWAAMYAFLFPEASAADCLAEIDRILAAPDRFGFIAEDDGADLGFAELSIRPFANGCLSQPVPFLEGIWCAPEARRRGVGAALLAHVEAFARARGFTELGSDVEMLNTGGQGFHRATGFEETERVIYMRKSL